MIRATKVRALTICWVMGVVFSGFSWRLIYLQVQRSEYYTGLANQSQVYRQNIPAHRGAIRDIHGEILANDLPLCRVIADASHMAADVIHILPDGTRTIEDTLPKIAHLLAGSLEIEEKPLLDKLLDSRVHDRRYLVVKRQVPAQTGEDLKAALAVAKLKGVFFEPDSTRIYPDSSLLCHVIGFTDFTGDGVQGIEKSMNSYLQGHDGYRYITHDRIGAELVQHRGIEQAPQDGYDVNLTIDAGLQAIVERELDAAVKKYTPENATIILMRPKTGEILAMASRPHFDLNEREHTDPEQMKNRAIINVFEPGSTFKIVTVSGVLSEKLVRPDTSIYCENGHWEFAGKVLHDAHPIGTIPATDVLVHSSNIGVAKLALQLGDDRLYGYIKAMGFGDRTGIDLPGEVVGILNPLRKWTKISIARIPMGQGVAVTPIQMVMAMGAIANEGKLMMPHIIHSITNEKHETVSDIAPVIVRQVASPEAVKDVVRALEDVVSPRGTAVGATVPGYRVAGKTGTAQKVSPNGGYMTGKYVVSFVGFLPANDPELVGMVMLDNAVTAHNLNFGGLVAAPIFASVAEQAMHHMNVDPPNPIAQNATGKPVASVAIERD